MSTTRLSPPHRRALLLMEDDENISIAELVAMKRQTADAIAYWLTEEANATAGRLFLRRWLRAHGGH